MADWLFMQAAEITDYVGYLGTAYAIGLGIGICTFLMGYGVWLLIDLIRGGL